MDHLGFEKRAAKLVGPQGALALLRWIAAASAGTSQPAPSDRRVGTALARSS